MGDNRPGKYRSEALEMVNGGLDQISAAVESGEISPADVVQMLKGRIPDIMNYSEELEYPSERWPDDKLPGEKAVDFLKRVLGGGTEEIPFYKDEIRQNNLALYQALTTHFRRYTQSSKLSEWWRISNIKSKEQVDLELGTHKIKNPEDAFRRSLDIQTAHRLYNAALRRQGEK